MQPSDWLTIIFYIVASCGYLQISASGNIGNRSYSSWYETHFLVERKGICKLIYFKPKHFGRYTLFEVACFFATFVNILMHIVLGVVWQLGFIEEIVTTIASTISVVLLMVSILLITIVNDIGSNKDEKKKFYNETGERVVQQGEHKLPPTGNKMIDQVAQKYIEDLVAPYYTIDNLWESYWTRISKAGKDNQKIEKINLQYIEYFKNIEKLVVIKKNKDGSLQLKISE